MPHAAGGQTSDNTAHDWFALAGFVAVCFAAAGLGVWLTGSAVTSWYQTLNKPSWNPLDWLFGPVWSVLYLMMAVAAWIVWQRLGWQRGAVPLILFAVQLVLNVAWSGLFFGLRSPAAALFEIVLLWGAILATLLSFWRVSRGAGWLMVPYLLWVSFASILNLAIWRLNG